MKKLFVLCICILTSVFSMFAEDIEFPFILKDEDFKNPRVTALINRMEKIRTKTMGWCSKEKADALISLMLNIQPKISVEVGVFGGSSLTPIAVSLQYLRSGKVFAVDSWNNQDCIRYMTDKDPNKSWWSSVNLNMVYNSFINILHNNGLHNVCTVLKSDSVQAAAHFADESIDFLHLNGNHTFLGTKRDIEAYLPKVKTDGYILVSDVMWVIEDNITPICEAVEDLFETCELIDGVEGDNVFLFKKI